MESMPVAQSTDPRVARLIDANLDRAREGLRVIEDWCRFGLDRQDLVVPLKDWRQQLGQLHDDCYREARSTATDTAAGLSHPAQGRIDSIAIVKANASRVQEALRVIEEFARAGDALARTAAAGATPSMTMRSAFSSLRAQSPQATAGGRQALLDHGSRH